MTCQKIKVDGGVMIVCGPRRRMTKKQKAMIEAQTALIERSRNATKFHRELAEKCNEAGLPVLAREHDYIAKALEEKIAMQMRAFRDGALAENS